MSARWRLPRWLTALVISALMVDVNSKPDAFYPSAGRALKLV
ncbi:MAG: hypothetical protein U1E36_07555 [Rickettsiales bacterium]